MTSLYPQKLALTSPTGGGRSVGIVLSRTNATGFFFFRLYRRLNKRRQHSITRLFIARVSILCLCYHTHIFLVSGDMTFVNSGLVSSSLQFPKSFCYCQARRFSRMNPPPSGAGCRSLCFHFSSATLKKNLLTL